MAQRYEPAIKDGDKRILLVDGTPLTRSSYSTASRSARDSSCASSSTSRRTA